jgi:regulator of protease activity HflC (stomatin/prohibitin superfamily)
MLMIIIVFAVIFYAFVALRVLRQYERGVVFQLGKFSGVRSRWCGCRCAPSPC